MAVEIQMEAHRHNPVEKSGKTRQKQAHLHGLEARNRKVTPTKGVEGDLSHIYARIVGGQRSKASRRACTACTACTALGGRRRCDATPTHPSHQSTPSASPSPNLQPLNCPELQFIQIQAVQDARAGKEDGA